jgi:hypothetical protein
MTPDVMYAPAYLPFLSTINEIEAIPVPVNSLSPAKPLMAIRLPHPAGFIQFYEAI